MLRRVSGLLERTRSLIFSSVPTPARVHFDACTLLTSRFVPSNGRTVGEDSLSGSYAQAYHFAGVSVV